MKIKKNLSDAEMFQDSSENYSFETEVLTDDGRSSSFRRKAQQPEKKELLLPEEAQEKLNRCLLEVSMEWLKDKNGEAAWKVKREGLQIIIEPAPAKKRLPK
jgi:hypothetical protein